MQSNFHIPEVVAKYEQRTEDALNVLGAHMVGMVDPPVRTGNLKSSITYATNTQQPEPKKKIKTGDALTTPDKPLTLKIGTNVEYAARIEFGFVGKDSAGRTFSQTGTPYLRPILSYKEDFKKFLIEKIKNG